MTAFLTSNQRRQMSDAAVRLAYLRHLKFEAMRLWEALKPSTDAFETVTGLVRAIEECSERLCALFEGEQVIA